MPDIAFFGKKRVGKTLAAYSVYSYLPDTYRVLSLARPMKDMLQALPGITLNHTDGPFKETALPKYSGKTARELLQTLGTEWGQKYIDPLIWPKMWLNKALSGSDKELRWYVCDDGRFEHELEFFKKNEVITVGVYRESLTESKDSHISEAFPFKKKDFDHTINNNGKISDFTRKVLALVKRCEKAHTP